MLLSYSLVMHWNSSIISMIKILYYEHIFIYMLSIFMKASAL